MREVNFKHTEIGLIPHDWEVKTISEVADNYTGLTYSPLNVCAFGGTLVLRSSNIQDDELSFKDNVFVNMEIPERAKTKENDVLICVRNGSSRLIGKSAMIPKEYENVAFGAFMTVLRAVKIDSGYLLYTWRSEPSQQQVHETFGATINQITDKDFKRILVPLPPTLAEQERIAGALSSIDTLIGALNEQIEKKRNIKQGTMQQLLTGKKRLAGFTGEWKEVRLGDNCAITTGHKDVNIAVPNGQYNFYTCSRDVYKANTYSFDTEAILIAGNGDVGNLHYHKGKFEVYQRTYVLYDFKADVQYILHNLAWNLITHLKQGVVGSTIPYIVIGQLLDYPLVLPPTITEQNAIAAVLSGMDTEIAALEQKRDKYIAIKSGMMQDLLTGKIRLV